MRRINLKWIIPITLCYLVVGFFVYASIRIPETMWVCAISILTVALLTMAIILGLDNGDCEVNPKH